MNKLHKKIAELSLIVAIPLTLENQVKPGRPKGILTRLKKHTYKALYALPALTKKETDSINSKVEHWGELSGWGRSNKHIATFASFALEMIERGDYPVNIKEDLVDLVDYFDRANKINTAPFWAGTLAYDKWIMVLEGEL